MRLLAAVFLSALATRGVRFTQFYSAAPSSPFPVGLAKRREAKRLG